MEGKGVPGPFAEYAVVRRSDAIERERERVRSWRRSNVGRARNYAGEAKRLYGIDPFTYETKLRYQQGLCAICLKPERAMRNGKPQRLSVDHDHQTGKARGLLCSACNRALGLLLEDDNTALRMGFYIREWRQVRANGVN